MIARLAVLSGSSRRELRHVADGITLTRTGMDHARTIIRSHRLWESYLVGEAGLREDHVHDPASHLEHVLTDTAKARVQPIRPGEVSDPHDQPIPPAGV